ncbi:hypothetical protein CSUI_005242 [Cystoisospora suis]|uniref:Uncharacterized protein n=1 Tax=Cystoisospora suis TaxID=483139 RepID=A0A2C6KVX0_9APIC|nr:hypothetical protein CSUI_005242 [Cystoisospora suis]
MPPVCCSVCAGRSRLWFDCDPRLHQSGSILYTFSSFCASMWHRRVVMRHAGARSADIQTHSNVLSTSVALARRLHSRA